MIIAHDDVVHHPLGGGSYVYKTCFIDYLLQQITKDQLRISIGAQPNSSPHFGTIIVFCLAFSLGEVLHRLRITVFFEIFDTAPAEIQTINGIDYQINLRKSGVADHFLTQYRELLLRLKQFSGIDFQIRSQEEFNSQSSIPIILSNILRNKEQVGRILDPERGLLRIRVACPHCGLTDKKGLLNKIDGTKIQAYCPFHGWHRTDILQASNKLEYNTPLRNLVRALVYSMDNTDHKKPFEWLRITGSDYAGFYQEHMLYRCASILGCNVATLPIIVYVPLVVDWSGAKLSKTLYVKKKAYSYLPSYLVNYVAFSDTLGNRGLKLLYEEVRRWVEEPYRLFRHYTVYYFMTLFERTDSSNQIVYEQS